MKLGGAYVSVIIVAIFKVLSIVVFNSSAADVVSMLLVQINPAGRGPSTRSGASTVQLSEQRAVLFGGVEDEDEEEKLKSCFLSDLYQLATDGKPPRWFEVKLVASCGIEGCFFCLCLIFFLRVPSLSVCLSVCLSVALMIFSSLNYCDLLCSLTEVYCFANL